MILEEHYMDWLSEIVSTSLYFKTCMGYRRLFGYLMDVPFVYILSMDKNREQDGIELRRRFLNSIGISSRSEEYLQFTDQPCSILEMLVALSLRCEGAIGEPWFDDHAYTWFWMMISNLGLRQMDDRHFDQVYVEDTVRRFLDRHYCSDGSGSLFGKIDRQMDMRKVEIWKQFCWYLDDIIFESETKWKGE